MSGTHQDKRKSNQESLGEVIDRMLKVYRLQSGLTEIALRSRWEEIVGKMISTRTEEIKLRGKKLYITINSAALRHELHYQRTDIMDNINRHLGSGTVEEVILK